MKRGNGAFRALIHSGAEATDPSSCIEADGRRTRPTFRLHGRDMNANDSGVA